jgi:ethanolamine ammonia-lyase small subunit
MSEQNRDPISQNPWGFLKEYTDARIALGRVGHGIPTEQLLTFSLAHAQAKDAVYASLHVDAMLSDLRLLGHEGLHLTSQAVDRDQYLKRPDLGRKLSLGSLQMLQDRSTGPVQVSLVIADGLSAKAIATNALPVLKVLLPMLTQAGITLAPITVVTQARVALADEIGFALKAALTVIFIGERPGLSSPDSMGIYLTYRPLPQNTDERRNCISNVRPRGLHWDLAAHKLFYLITQSLTLGISGVALKDEFDTSGLLS